MMRRLMSARRSARLSSSPAHRSSRAVVSAMSRSSASFSPFRVVAWAEAFWAAWRWSASCPVTSSTSSWRTARPSSREARRRSSRRRRPVQSLCRPFQSRLTDSHSACSARRRSSASDAATSASAILPSSAWVVAERLAASASCWAMDSCTESSFRRTWSRCIDTLSLSSARARTPSRTTASSSDCSCSWALPLSRRVWSRSCSSTLPSCFSCMRRKECSSNSRTHSSSAR
mmetsp:Transcript_59549/g.124429  ORF Transcript_59549/g.124429 Transcript_59549/m.124429 type:complete len:231 (-) Transcript_59549:515-1207(-)